jgi:hypothetical protein
MSWTNLNAWREILARVFENFAERHDVIPEWLINPDTNRKLKLDILYPDIGIAIRLIGLRAGSKPRRLSLEEEEQQRVRDSARMDVCRSHGINLVQIEIAGGEPAPILHTIRLALSDASRRVARSDIPHRQKADLIEQLSRARSRLEAVTRRVRRADDLRIYADLWQDRQYAAAASQPERPPINGRAVNYVPGMAVHHTAFGSGIVESLQDDKTGGLVTVRFHDGSQRTFAANLVADKMVPCP